MYSLRSRLSRPCPLVEMPHARPHRPPSLLPLRHQCRRSRRPYPRPLRQASRPHSLSRTRRHRPPHHPPPLPHQESQVSNHRRIFQTPRSQLKHVEQEAIPRRQPRRLLAKDAASDQEARIGRRLCGRRRAAHRCTLCSRSDHPPNHCPCTAHYVRDGSGNGAQLKCPSTRSRALLAISTSTSLPKPTQKRLPSNTSASPATIVTCRGPHTIPLEASR